MPSVQITTVETEDAGGARKDLFNPYTDPLRLAMFFSLSADAGQLPNLVLSGTFQIIELRTNLVVVDQVVQSNYDPAWGQSLLWWMGSPTPRDWGLQWVAGDIFGVRTAVELFQWQGEQGLLAVDAFDVSQVSWFRLMDVFGL